ncbi:MAG: hypothetical protein K2Q24_04975 [Chitinophagaceae bacterium]|jgi:hypothetical protein|nr:hypothetical protein [Chitinophagaceae bacterium]
MKNILLLFPFFFKSYSATSQEFLKLKQVGLSTNYGTTKFFKTGTLGRNFGIPFISTDPPNKTVFFLDILPSASFYLTNRIELFTYAGIELHKIRSIFEAYDYPPYYKNLLWKIGAGPEIRILGKNHNTLHFKLQTILTYEDFIKNNSGPFGSQDAFGNGFLMYDYAGSKARVGLDITPYVDVLVTPKASLRAGVGYSFGLNKSNRRVVYSWDDLRNGRQGYEVFNRKEKSFIFSIGFFTNVTKNRERKHLKLKSLFY